MPDVSVTWLGHASFRVDSPGGKRIYVDPWLGNPKCPESEQEPERVDVIALTHGHGDHVGETVELGKQFSPEIVAHRRAEDLAREQGAEVGEMPGSNKGGTVEADGVKFTLVNAFHSSATDDLTYLGEAAGIVIEFENGTTIYFAGDTCVFGDMQLIGRIYAPDVAILPIGGHFTMDPREAGVALELLGDEALHPLPLRHLPAARRHARRAARAGAGCRSDRARARGDDDGLRERWFGATGRRCRRSRSRESSSWTMRSCWTTSPTRPFSGGARGGPAGRGARGLARGGQGRASPARGRDRARPDPARAARPRPHGADLWLSAGSSRPTRSPPATSTPGSGASRRSRSSSASGRSSRGQSPESARSRPRPTRTRATGRTGSRSSAKA